MPMFKSSCRLVLSLLLLTALRAPSEEVPLSAPVAEIQNPTGSIGLAEALALALVQNLDLQTYAWDIRAAEARGIQAGLRPNPELSVELENLRFGRGPATRSSALGLSTGFTPEFQHARESGSQSGLSEAEVTVRVSQLIELGGKRSKRVRLANRERDTAAWDYEVARLNVLSGTAKSFYAVLEAQERLRLAKELEVLARQTLDSVIARVDAGKVSPIEAPQGEAEYALVKLEVERVQLELETARVHLASFWGLSAASFTEAVGSLGTVEDLPPLGTLAARAEAAPDLARWMAEIEQRDAEVELERANGKPDLTVTLGLRSTQLGSTDSTSYSASGSGDWSWSRGGSAAEEARENSAVLGFSLPLTFSNRNQGRILEAEHLAAKAAARKRADTVQIQSKLTAAYHTLESAQLAIRTISTDVLPKAQEVFDATNEGYRLGKFSLVEVLLSQHRLFTARASLLAAQSTYAQHWVDLERLSGQPLSPLTESNTSIEVKP